MPCSEGIKLSHGRLTGADSLIRQLFKFGQKKESVDDKNTLSNDFLAHFPFICWPDEARVESAAKDAEFMRV